MKNVEKEKLAAALELRSIKWMMVRKVVVSILRRIDARLGLEARQ